MKRCSNLTRISLLYAALLIWLGMACASVTKVAPAADITGKWKTSFETPEGDLDIFLNIQKSSDGTLTATNEVPLMGAYDMPLIFSFENGVVHFEVEEFGVSFNGKLIDPSTIEGVVSSQAGGESWPAIYKRVE